MRQVFGNILRPISMNLHYPLFNPKIVLIIAELADDFA